MDIIIISLLIISLVSVVITASFEDIALGGIVIILSLFAVTAYLLCNG
jgi:hypothetical protein